MSENDKKGLPFSDIVEGGKVTKAGDDMIMKKPFPESSGTAAVEANDCYWAGLRFSEGAQVTQGSRTFTCTGGKWTVS